MVREMSSRLGVSAAIVIVAPVILTVTAKAIYLCAPMPQWLKSLLDGFNTSNTLGFLGVAAGVLVAIAQVFFQLSEQRDRDKQRALGEMQCKIAADKEIEKRILARKPVIAAMLERENEIEYTVLIENQTGNRYRSIYYYEEMVGSVLKPDATLRFRLVEVGLGAGTASGSVQRAAVYSDFQSVGYPSVIDISLFDEDGNLWAIGMHVSEQPEIGGAVSCFVEDPDLIAVAD